MIPIVLAYMGSFFGTVAVIPQIIKVLNLKEANCLSYAFLLLRICAFLCFMLLALI